MVISPIIKRSHINYQNWPLFFLLHSTQNFRFHGYLVLGFLYLKLIQRVVNISHRLNVENILLSMTRFDSEKV